MGEEFMRAAWLTVLIVALGGVIASRAALSQEGEKERVEKLLEEIEPLFGRTVTVCAGQSAPGWAVQNVSTDFTTCGGSWDNIWTLVELNGASPGQRVTVCSFSSSHPGWGSVGTSTDFTRCGRNQSFNNLTTIQKL